MKPSYSTFEAKANKSYIDLPPVGAYVAEIKKAEEVDHFGRQAIEIMLDICEGEYKDRYTEVWRDQDEKWGNATYRGTFRIVLPIDNDEDWRKRQFEGNLWCVQESNPGYAWDWDEKKLKGKKVGISVRKKLYTGKDKDGNEVDRETTEIAKFETVDDVRNGKCKPVKERDTRKNKTEQSNNQQFTPVESSEVSVPW